MSVIRKLLAVALTAAMAVSLVSCADTSAAATVDGTSIRAGIYIYYLRDAIYEGQQQLTDEAEESGSSEAVTDIFDKTIDDQDFSDWAKDKATVSLQKHVAIERKFDELGLTVDEAMQHDIDSYKEYYWDEEYYNKLGISEQSYEDIVTNMYKQDAVFNKYYDEGGLEEVPESDLTVYLEDNYVRYKAIPFELTDGEGEDLDADGKADVLDMAKEYLERAKDDEDFDDLIAEYTEYRAKLEAEAAGEEYTEPEESEEEDPYVNERITNIDTTYISDGFKTFLFETAKADEPEIYQNDEEGYYYLVLKLDILEREDLLEDYRSTILHAIKDEEFGTLADSWAEPLEVVRNEDAYSRYKPSKVGKDIAEQE